MQINKDIIVTNNYNYKMYRKQPIAVAKYFKIAQKLYINPIKLLIFDWLAIN